MSVLDVESYLSHGCEESLRVEESRHPEGVGPPVKAPGVKLLVPVKQLGEPEPQRGRRPGDLAPADRDAPVVHAIQRVPQILVHDDGAVDG